MKTLKQQLKEELFNLLAWKLDDVQLEVDQIRVDRLDEINVLPFIMPFNKSDPYQKAYTRYINWLKESRKKKKITFKGYCERFHLDFQFLHSK